MVGQFFSLTEKNVERRMIILMLAVGFCMGVFNATYQVVADSIFLKRLPGQLNNAFLTAGVLGIVVTSIFSNLQSRIRFSVLVTFSLSIIVIFTTAVYWGYHFGPSQYHDQIVYMMYCATGPITVLLLMSYWGIFGRLFDFSQSKRIISWIDSGQIIASILAFLLFPFTSAYFGDTSNYLIVSITSIVFAAILLVVVALSFKLVRNDPKEFGAEFRKETRLSNVLKDPYGISLSAFAVVSMVCFVFTHFSFQQLSNVQYPEQKDLANFLAYFNGSIYLVSLIMQTFVNDKILSNYGLRISLFVLPVALMIFAAGSIISGIVIGTTPDENPTLFVFFFLFIALTRWFNWMFRDSLETPVFKLFFIPIDSKFRFGVQSKVEGVINESGRFFAGAIIFGLSVFVFFNVVWISVLLLLAGVCYFVFASKMHGGYRGKIREKLETKDAKQEKLEFGLTAIVKRLEAFLFQTRPSSSVFSFKLLEKINPSEVPKLVNTLMKHEADEVQGFAQSRMNELKGLSVSERYIIRGTVNVAGKIKLSKNDLDLLLQNGGEISRSRIQQLVRSEHFEDRIYASELLLHSNSDENLSLLMELLSDSDRKVRLTAIKTSSKRFNDEVIFVLIENLPNQLFSNYAMESLVAIGGKALSQLENAFYRAGQLNSTLIKIIHVMGRIGGSKAKEMLWNKVDYPDMVIVSQVLLALGSSGFKAGPNQSTRIRYAVEADVEDINWNLNAIREVGDEGETEELKKALRVEINGDIEHLYKLLAMLYDTRSIQLVKENIESGTAEGVAYAVELLDIFLPDQLKQRIIPVLDDLSDSEKISRLEVLYPRVPLDEKLVLKFLVNRNFTQTNRWTKACALHRIGLMKLREFAMDLIAHMYNPDRLIRETSAWALYQIDAEMYLTSSKHVGLEYKQLLDRAILTNYGSHLMEFEKIKFFQSIEALRDMPGITLSYLADLSEEVTMSKGEELTIAPNFNSYFYIIYHGSIEHAAKGVATKKNHRGDFIGEVIMSSPFSNAHLLRAEEKTVLLKLEKDDAYELLADKISLTEKFLELV